MTVSARLDDVTTVVDVQDLTMRYGEAQVLDGVSFSVSTGEVVALLGPNGAGKSTTIEVLEGLRRPSSGRVRVLGLEPVRADDDWRSRIGVVLQTWSDHDRWRVGELVEHLRRLYRARSARPVRGTDELLALTGLTSVVGQRLSTLSGGQRRRLDIALSMLARPELVLMDEPTAGFDPEGRRTFHELVRALSASDTSCLITTHDLDEAERIADRIIVIALGQVVAAGTLDELAEQTGAGDEVTWTARGRRHRRLLTDSTAFVRDLMAADGQEVSQLKVRRRSLEEIYLSITRAHERPGAPGVTPALPDDVVAELR